MSTDRPQFTHPSPPLQEPRTGTLRREGEGGTAGTFRQPNGLQVTRSLRLLIPLIALVFTLIPPPGGREPGQLLPGAGAGAGAPSPTRNPGDRAHYPELVLSDKRQVEQPRKGEDKDHGTRGDT